MAANYDNRPKLKFWKPGADAPDESNNEERPEGFVQTTIFNPNASLSIEKQRERLPIFRYRTHILYLLETRETVIVVGETGCGKSTQVPQYLLEAGWAAGGRVIAVTQPRRVAAISVAKRIAEERGTSLGQEVGYAIRFENCWDETKTRIKFVTDGLLVREMMSDPLLSRYSVIMLDEAHERTLQTDIVIGLLKKIQLKRKDLRIIVTSATLDAQKVYDFFNNNTDSNASHDTVAALSVEGRTFPVEIFYADNPVPDYVKATSDTVLDIHRSEPRSGDILAFLTGQEEVETVVRALIEAAKKLPKDAMRLKILPMYSGLPGADQMKVFERTPPNTRKVVVATNIAEASITIDGITFVVDCGFVKLCAYNPRCGVDALVVVAISQASADQRAGRAGRVRAGKVYRLYTESAYAELLPATIPEMQRTDTAPMLLQLKALGIDNILRFSFLSAPPAENVVRGLELLYALRAIDDACHLTTPLGVTMAELPLAPMFSCLLLSSKDFGCSEEAVTLAAMVQIQNIFTLPPNQKSQAEKQHRRFSAAEGDHVTAVNVYNAFVRAGKSSRWCKEHFLNYKGLKRADELREQLVRLAHKFKVSPLISCDGDVDAIRRCLTTAFFANAAKFHASGVYRTIRDDHVLYIHPTSVLYTETPADCVLFGEIVHTSREFMRDVTVIKAEWLYELAPHYYQYGTERQLAAKRARIT